MSEKIETKAEISLNDYLEISRKMKEIEKAILDSGSKTDKTKLKELKKKEKVAKAKPEKSLEHSIIFGLAKTFLKENYDNIEKVFKATVTTEKEKGQKWVIFNEGTKDNPKPFSLGIINNQVK